MCKLSVLILDYEHKVKFINELKGNPCMFLLGVPYDQNSHHENMIYLDILSQKKNSEKCTFVNSVSLLEILECTKKIVKNKNPSILLFDDLHCLLNYHQCFEIINFTNNLKLMDGLKDTQKYFFISKEKNHLEDETKTLTNDLKLFADKFIELS